MVSVCPQSFFTTGDVDTGDVDTGDVDTGDHIQESLDV